VTEYHCRWAGPESPRLLRAHLPACDSAACGGCQPCPERHCRRCNREHVTVDGIGTDQTCGDCLAETRDNLEHCWVTPELVAEALIAGVASEAAMLIGPTAADLDVWQRRHRLIVNAAMAAPDEPHHPAHRALLAWMEDCRDERHPLWVLGTWEQRVRDHLNQPAPKRAPVTAAAARTYLDGHLTRLAHDENFEFDDLARELADCRTHLEEVARNSRRPETGAPCLTCRVPLERTWGKIATADGWTCPRCKETSTETQYRLAVSQAHQDLADELPLKQLAERIGVTFTRVRHWSVPTRHVSREHGVTTSDPKIKPSRMLNGRKVYRVADAIRVRDELDREEETS